MADGELPEAGELNAVAVGQKFVDEVFEGTDYLVGFAEGDAGALGQHFSKT